MSWKKTVYYGKKKPVLEKNPLLSPKNTYGVSYVVPKGIKARTSKIIQMDSNPNVEVLKSPDGSLKSLTNSVFRNTEGPDKEYLKNCFFNQCFDKGRLKNFVLWFLKNYGQNKTVKLVEQLKNIGFEYASKAGISLGIDDLKIPQTKNDLIFEAEKNTTNTIHQYARGEITGVERFQRLIDTWHSTSEGLKQEVIDYFEATDILNPVYMMAFSGARGNISQVRQLVGMRGLMADPQGQIIDYPIRSNFREGLTITEYLISSYGARKGIVDTALRTANAGYLTRRLVDVAQHVIISHFDCGTYRGIFLKDMKEGNKTIHSLIQRVVGRILARDIIDTTVISKGEVSNTSEDSVFQKTEGPDLKTSYLDKTNSILTGEKKELREYPIIAKRNQEITMDLAFTLVKKFDKIFVRSPLTCETNQLICQLCYGWSLGQGSTLVSIGEAVGVVAAQSIGEPGTQLTMRTFHTGGVFSGDISDQIRAPFDAIVEYPTAIPGTLIRTPEGKIAFLTKGEGSFTIKKIESDMLYSAPLDNIKGDESSLPSRALGGNLKEKSENSVNTSLSSETTRKFKIPGYTLLYIRNKQSVYEKEVIAQISTISRKSNATDAAELTIPSEYEGQFYSKTLDFREKFVGDAKLMESTLAQLRNQKSTSEISSNSFNVDYIDKLYEAWNWGYAWVLSGKIYELNLRGESCFPRLGDLVNSQSSMNQTQWNFNFNNGPAKIYYPFKQPQLGNKNTSYRLPKLLGPTKYQKHLNRDLSPSNVTLAQPVLFLDILKIRFKKYGYILTSRNKNSSFIKNFFPSEARELGATIFSQPRLTTAFGTSEHSVSSRANYTRGPYEKNFDLGHDLLFRMYEIHPRLTPILEKETDFTQLRKKQNKKGKNSLLHWFPYQSQTSTGGFMLFEKVFKNIPLNSKTENFLYKPSKLLKSKIQDNTHSHSISTFNLLDSSFFDVSFSQRHRFTDSKNIKSLDSLDSQKQSSDINFTTPFLRSGCTQSPVQGNIFSSPLLQRKTKTDSLLSKDKLSTESQISSKSPTNPFKRPSLSNIALSGGEQTGSEALDKAAFETFDSSQKQSYTASLKAEFLKELKTEFNTEKMKTKSLMESSSFFKFYKFKGLIPKQNKLIPLSSEIFKNRKFGMRWKNSYELYLKTRLDFLYISNNTNNSSTSLGTQKDPYSLTPPSSQPPTESVLCEDSSVSQAKSTFSQKKFEEKLKNDDLNVLFNKRILWIPHQYFQINRTLRVYLNKHGGSVYNKKNSLKHSVFLYSVPLDNVKGDESSLPSRGLRGNLQRNTEGLDFFSPSSELKLPSKYVRNQVRPGTSFETPPSSALFFSKLPLFIQTNRQGILKPFISFINYPSLLTTFNLEKYSDLEIDFNTIKNNNKTSNLTPFKQNKPGVKEIHRSSFKQSFGFLNKWYYCPTKSICNNIEKSKDFSSYSAPLYMVEGNESMLSSRGSARSRPYERQHEVVSPRLTTESTLRGNLPSRNLRGNLSSFKETLDFLNPKNNSVFILQKNGGPLNSKNNYSFINSFHKRLFGPSLFHFITFSTLVSFTEKKNKQNWLSSFKKGGSFCIPSTYNSFLHSAYVNNVKVDESRLSSRSLRGNLPYKQNKINKFKVSDLHVSLHEGSGLKQDQNQTILSPSTLHKFHLSQKYRYSNIISNSIKRQIKKLNCFEHKEQLALYLLSLNFKQTLYDIFPDSPCFFKETRSSYKIQSSLQKFKSINSNNSQNLSLHNNSQLNNLSTVKTNINLKKGWVYLNKNASELMSYHKTVLYPGQVNNLQLNVSRPLYLECHAITDVFDFEKQFLFSVSNSNSERCKKSTFTPKKLVKNSKPRYTLPGFSQETRNPYFSDKVSTNQNDMGSSFFFKFEDFKANVLSPHELCSQPSHSDGLNSSLNSGDPENQQTFSKIESKQQKRKKLISYLNKLQSLQNTHFSETKTNTIVLLLQPIEEYHRMNTKELKTYVHESTFKEDPMHNVHKINLTKKKILVTPFLSSFFKKQFFESHQYNKQKNFSHELSKFPTSDIQIYPMSFDNNFAIDTSLGNEKIQTPYYRSLNKHKRPINFSPFFLSFNRPMGLDSIFKDQLVSLSYQPFSNLDSLALPLLSSHLSNLFQIYLNLGLRGNLSSRLRFSEGSGFPLQGKQNFSYSNFTSPYFYNYSKLEDITQSLQADFVSRLIENPCFCFQNISYFKNPVLTFENLQTDFFSFSSFSAKRSKLIGTKTPSLSPSKLLFRNSSRTPKSSTLFSFSQRNEMFLGVKPVAKTNIFSPFNGEVVLLNVNKGCMVLTSSNLMSYYLAPNGYSLNNNMILENSNKTLQPISTNSDLRVSLNKQEGFGEIKTSEYLNPIKPNYSINNILVKFLNMTDVKLDFDLACKLNVIPTPSDSNSDNSTSSPVSSSARSRQPRLTTESGLREASTWSGAQAESTRSPRLTTGSELREAFAEPGTHAKSTLSVDSEPSKPSSKRVMSNIQSKLVKVSNLVGGQPKDLNIKVRLGDFCVYGDPITNKTAIQTSGQLIHYNKQKITLRRSQPIFISPKGILHKFDNDFVDSKTPVITLSYQKLKTGDIIQGIPKVEQFFEARTTKRGRFFRDSLPYLLKSLFKRYSNKLPLDLAVRQSFYKIQQILVDGVHRVYKAQGVTISDKHLEVIVKQMTSKVRVIDGAQTGFFPGEVLDLFFVEKINSFLMKKITYEPLVLGITKASLEVDSFLSSASFQQTTRVLSNAAIFRKKDFLKGLKENVILGNLIPAGTGFLVYIDL